MEHHFSHRLPAHEVARRQRWVTVGVTILVILIVALWLSTLPARIGTNAHSFDSFFGITRPAPQYVSQDVIDTTQQDASFQANLDAFNQAVDTQKKLQALTAQPLSTSTIEAVKQKLK